MLKRKNRLTAKVKLRGKSFNTQFFIFKAAKNDLDYNRAAFVISKKAEKKAVARNRVKRVLRSCLEEIFEDLKTGYDFLFIIKKEALNEKRESLCDILNGILKKEGFLK